MQSLQKDLTVEIFYGSHFNWLQNRTEEQEQERVLTIYNPSKCTDYKHEKAFYMVYCIWIMTYKSVQFTVRQISWQMQCLYGGPIHAFLHSCTHTLGGLGTW